jgi:hypothetical protein
MVYYKSLISQPYISTMDNNKIILTAKPKKVTTKNLAVNIILLLSIVLIYGCEIRLL